MAPMPETPRVAVLTLTPLALVSLGATAGGDFAVAAMLYVALTGLVADLGAPSVTKARPVRHLSLGLAAGHFLSLPFVLMALAGQGPGVPLDLGERVALFLATAGLIAQASLPAAHALMHRPAWWQRWIGAMVYTSLGFGHHVSAHRLVHHVHLGTYGDPMTPLPGEGFWTYLRRAWAEGFRAGRMAEEDKLARHGIAPMNWRNPYWLWLGGEIGFLAGAVLMAGPVGVLALLALWLVAGGTVLMGDYLRHYGLRRRDLPSGGREPVAAHHAWHGPGAAENGPRLPLPLPTMALLAGVPPLWRRVMDPRARAAMAAEWRAERPPEATGRTDAADVGPRGAGGSDEETEDMALAMEEDAARDAASGRNDGTADVADGVPENAAGQEEDVDGALIARVQGLVNAAPVASSAPTPAGFPRATARLKLSRPVRSSRRAALRDR